MVCLHVWGCDKFCSRKILVRLLRQLGNNKEWIYWKFFPFTRFLVPNDFSVSLVQGHLRWLSHCAWCTNMIRAFFATQCGLCTFISSFLHLYIKCMHMWIAHTNVLYSLSRPRAVFVSASRSIIYFGAWKNI